MTAAPTAHADLVIYRCTDASGAVTVQNDQRCPAGSREERRVIDVGHEPTLSDDMAALVGIEPARVELKKGGCYGVRIAPDGTATLEWLLSPRVLRKID